MKAENIDPDKQRDYPHVSRYETSVGCKVVRDAKTRLLNPSNIARVCERAMLRMLDRLSETGAERKATTRPMKRIDAPIAPR